MFQTEALIFPTAPSPMAFSVSAHSNSILSFLSSLSHTTHPNHQSILISQYILFKYIWNLTTSHHCTIIPRPHYLSPPNGCSFPTGLLIQTSFSLDSVFWAQQSEWLISWFPFHWVNDLQGPCYLFVLICHSSLHSLCWSATGVLANLQTRQVPMLLRMLSPWVTLTWHLLCSWCCPKAGHVLTHLTIPRGRHYSYPPFRKMGKLKCED